MASDEKQQKLQLLERIKRKEILLHSIAEQLPDKGEKIKANIAKLHKEIELLDAIDDKQTSITNFDVPIE